eukprot:TRINITY_DN72981_c0_g1_i1.p2 TRINITY_DN72981_c0_g1~~TRINITY_DN72981_c0_g1_i1.p2  ORF type:complete len:277 (+),score=74.29 TRINITY_DN72981_c0_g1_i1:162-992(+)
MVARGPMMLLVATGLARGAPADMAGAKCFPGLCRHGKREKGDIFGKCMCDPFWEGDCCDKPKCKNVGGNLAENVSIDEWTRATWYIQEQQITGYQKAESLYCVTATYNLENQKVPKIFPGVPPWWDGTVVTVYNYANKYRANGPLQNEDNSTLCGRVEDPEEPGKLLVAPCFLPNYLAGPYWIVEIGRDEKGAYEWAVVVGGEPTIPFADGCTTQETGVNNAGLWLLSRTPTASEEQLFEMRAALKEKGLSTERLLKVEQEGCNYTGAYIKPNVKA